eukprot:m.719963 g.719963  ORF g.719963 m.719963 type:complete len:725 (+) comp23003_c0_seq2:394-2568(+)
MEDPEVSDASANSCAESETDCNDDCVLCCNVPKDLINDARDIYGNGCLGPSKRVLSEIPVEDLKTMLPKYRTLTDADTWMEYDTMGNPAYKFHENCGRNANLVKAAEIDIDNVIIDSTRRGLKCAKCKAQHPTVKYSVQKKRPTKRRRKAPTGLDTMVKARKRSDTKAPAMEQIVRHYHYPCWLLQHGRDASAHAAVDQREVKPGTMDDVLHPEPVDDAMHPGTIDDAIQPNSDDDDDDDQLLPNVSALLCSPQQRGNEDTGDSHGLHEWTPTRSLQQQDDGNDVTPPRARCSTGSGEMPSSIASENRMTPTMHPHTPGRSGLEMLPNEHETGAEMHSPAQPPRGVPTALQERPLSSERTHTSTPTHDARVAQHQASPSVLVSSAEVPASLVSTGEGQSSTNDSLADAGSSGNSLTQGGKQNTPECSSDPTHSATATQRTASQITPGQRTPGCHGGRVDELPSTHLRSGQSSPLRPLQRPRAGVGAPTPPLLPADFMESPSVRSRTRPSRKRPASNTYVASSHAAQGRANPEPRVDSVRSMAASAGEEGGCGASKRQRSNQQHCAQDNASMPRDGCNQHESAPVPVAPPIAAPRTEASSLHTGSTRAPPVQWLQDNKSAQAVTRLLWRSRQDPHLEYMRSNLQRLWQRIHSHLNLLDTAPSNTYMDGELQRTHDDIRAFQDVFRRDFAVFLQRVEAAIASEQQAQIADVRLNQSIPEFDRGASR